MWVSRAGVSRSSAIPKERPMNTQAKVALAKQSTRNTTAQSRAAFGARWSVIQPPGR